MDALPIRCCSVVAIGSVPAMSETEVALNGKVLSMRRKQGLVFVLITATRKVVTVVLREEDKNLEEDNDVMLRKDGTLEHLPCLETMSTTSTTLEVANDPATEMSTLEECFAEAHAQRCRAGGFKVGDDEREVFSDMGLTFKKVKTVQGVFADMTESVDSEEEYQKLCEIRNFLADTGGACSLAYAGPTSASADETVLKKLVFSCGDRACPCQSTKRYTLHHLMPTMVGPVKKDLCFDAFNKQMGEKITKEAFVIGVATMRTGEKYAVKVLAALFVFLSVCLSSVIIFKVR